MLAASKADIEMLYEQPPASGKVIKIADGLLWGRLPLPFRLNHVNVWFLKENNGWTVVDCGANGLNSQSAGHAYLLCRFSPHSAVEICRCTAGQKRCWVALLMAAFFANPPAA